LQNIFILELGEAASEVAQPVHFALRILLAGWLGHW